MPNVRRIAASAAIATLQSLLVGVGKGNRASLARETAQARFDPRNRALAHFCLQYIDQWKNKQYEVADNGEAVLLRRLARFQPRVLIDVGANIGDWAVAACEALPRAVVHAFEIVPETAEMLTRQTAPFGDRVTVNTVGLGDTEQVITLFLAADDSTIASTVREAFSYSATAQGSAPLKETQGRIITGDAYLAGQGIDHVDMLKIDVEGAEPGVLQGFAGAFARGAIDLVQFEYGPLNLVTRYFLGDFCQFFAGHGYAVGKLYPEGVGFKPYTLDDEDFVGANYVACREARSDLIEALRCPPLTADLP